MAKGAEHLSLGVGSDFRLRVSPTPLVIDRAAGPHVFDADGNAYIDYYLGMGPMILGHGPERVIEAVRRQVGTLVLAAAQSEIEYEAARLVCEMVPCADLVRFCSSGSEAVQAALRLARAATGRAAVVKFEGHYHGWFDNVLWSHAPAADETGPRDAPHRVPGSAGQDPGAGATLDVLAWNDLDAVVRRLEAGDVAAVIMEPVMGNTSAVWPAPGYLEGVRDACTRTGTILVFDEVITGFRLAPGGAQERLSVTPDLATFGKALASGFPVAAVAGRRDLMEQFGAGGRAMHAGTYNGQAVCMAATVATLEELRAPGVHDALERTGAVLRDGIASILAEGGLEAVVQGPGTIFHVALGMGGAQITDYRSSLAADKGAYVRLTTALLDRGVRALERGAWFVSTAHGSGEIDETLAAVKDAVAEQ